MKLIRYLYSRVKSIDFRVCLLLALTCANLLFMHYSFYVDGYLEWLLQYSEVVNLFAVVFDVSFILFINLVFFRGRLKAAVSITFAFTLIWSFVNVFYGRFFYQYLPLSAISEAKSLGEGLVFKSALSGFCWLDVFFVISTILFILIYRRTPKIQLGWHSIFKLLIVPVISLLITFAVYTAYHFIHPHYRNNLPLYTFRLKEFLYDAVSGGTPNLSHYQTGSVRVAIYEIFDLFVDKELTAEQRREIESVYQDRIARFTNHQRNPEIRNVIFILLESFLSTPIDLVEDGKEITPFLNSLKRDSTVYYNGQLKSDITCGESGDGQFIVMNGLLPLRYKMTVSQVKQNVLPSLPKVLKDKLGVKHTEIVIPSRPNLWQQSDMNVVYGIDDAYSQMDIAGDLTSSITDQQVFDYATKLLNPSKEPFFTLILSVSTHSPYDTYMGDDLKISNKSYSSEYKNYLNTCHYTDIQLRHYFEKLMHTGIYAHSLIVIASDHYAHVDALQMQGKIENLTPLFIINGNIDNKDAWSGKMNQIDVYTTILDILQIDNKWKGLGRSILSPEYTNTIEAHTHQISEMIIEGDYFAPRY